MGSWSIRRYGAFSARHAPALERRPQPQRRIRVQRPWPHLNAERALRHLLDTVRREGRRVSELPGRFATV